MTTLNSTLQLALLNRKKARNALEKGFTLVELMIVIVIVGVLSAVALPNFIGTKDKAEAGATIGSMTGLAKECSVNAIQESRQAIPGVITSSPTPTATDGILLTPLNASGAATPANTNNCELGATLSNIKKFTADKIGGMKCGAVATASGVNEAPDDNGQTGATTSFDTCTLTIESDGSLTGAWS